VKQAAPPVPPAISQRATPWPTGDPGSALVEALVALTLMAFAGSIVAAAAATNLRATRQAASIEALTALAARELAGAQARGAPVASEDGPVDVPGVRDAERRLTVTHDPSGIAQLDVRLTASGARPLHLSTRTLLSE
jgi:hypothetical protein